jgi:exonuclease SbcC
MAEVLEIQNKISEISSQVPKFAEIEKKYESASKELDEISRKTRLLEISLAQKSREVELLSEQLQGINEEILKKEKIKEQLNYLRELQDWLQEKFLQIITAIETNVLAALRTEFSKLFNEWFTMLVSDDLSVRLDETFTPIISNQDYEIDYDFLSGGERTAVALAYRLALNQILNSMLSKPGT